MDYRKSLEQAILYIENHLSEDLYVEEAARQAGYSYYHLTRQFQAVLGESVGSYIKKRRLADAAKQLLYTDLRILDIALGHGFESGEAFSRAFKTLYLVTPIEYRKNRLDLLIGSKAALDSRQIEHLSQNVTVHPRFVTIPEFKAAGLRGQTTLADNTLPELWTRLCALSPQIPNKSPKGRAFGICEACGEGNTLYTMNSHVLFSEVAAIQVDSFEGLPELFVKKTIAAGRYAVFTHTGSLSLLPDTFSYIWSTWFLGSGEELDYREDFELYDERFLGFDHPQSQIDLYIPVK